jgi:cytochrome b561
MLLMPLTGYLGTGTDTQFFGLFTIPMFADTAVYDALVTRGLGIDFDSFEAPVDWLHKTLGEIAVLALVGVHVAAALFHHFIRRDGALTRMFTMRQAAKRRN